MGILVAMRYPTNLALGFADHTYVECKSGGKGWACFGGKTNGTLLTSGSGSTNRADQIAEPNEQAGLKCYLVNGVCHQAANRVLFPAGVLVRGARGYKLSESIYGPYGRPRGWPCASPFNQHAGVTGDLAACTVASMRSSNQQEFNSEWGYIEGALAIYRDHGALEAMSIDERGLVDLHVNLFMHLVAFQLGGRIEGQTAGKLASIRAAHERDRIRIEDGFFKESIPGRDFVKAISDLERQFQKDVGSVLTVDDFCALLGTYPEDLVTLADPQIVERIYGGGTHGGAGGGMVR
jgi:hypothetical protein